ncbi:MAG: hypothetical protein J6Y97_02130 [Prevotella sp.]|nr:hypothetical protein [Prevotella sp.]
MKKTLLSTMLLCCACMMQAQTEPLKTSTVFNDDGTVTFYYQNKNAKEVQVDVQFAGRKPMELKDAQSGLWTATLGPAAPDMYPYCFVVDGISVMDPLCDQYFPNEGFKNSLLEIPSKKGPLLHDVQKVMHGTVEYVNYYSQSLQATNHAVVYLPPTYQRSRTKKYPVFYLISGTTDTEEVYYKVGRINYILDNLLARGEAEEMIVVLPYGNPSKLMPAMQGMGGFPRGGGRMGGFPGGMPNGGGFPGGGQMPSGGFPGGGMPNGGGFPGGGQMGAMPNGGGFPGGGMPGGGARMGGGMPGGMGMMFGRDLFSLDLINDLMPYVEEHYRTIADRDHRAIGGFSRGGNQALSNGLNNLDKFSYLCSYSSFTSTDIANVYDNAEDTNSKIHLFWLGVGTDDFLYGTARDYMEFLDKKGIRSVKEFTSDKYGHTWMNAKYFLDKSLRLLFRPQAAEEAMKNGKPAPAATGNEQQFTGETMARLFPRPIISPEYKKSSIVFRFKAPDAKSVAVVGELYGQPMQMKKDDDGVWSVEIKDHAMETFTYYFLVDGTQVADPNNMYLAPSKGFKPSIASHPSSDYNFAKMGNIEHGELSYNIQSNEAWYISHMSNQHGMPIFIQLIPGKDDTIESWFKVGGANAIADVLINKKKTKPCIITTSSLDFIQKSDDPNKPTIHTLRADDYKTWAERRKALETLLLKLK